MPTVVRRQYRHGRRIRPGDGPVENGARRPPHLKAIAPGLAGAPGEAGPETADAPVNLNIAVSLLLILAGDVLDRLDAGGAEHTRDASIARPGA